MIVNQVLTEFFDQHNIPIFAITGTDDFEHALQGWHPKDLMPVAKRFILYGRPFIEHPRSVNQKTHIADESWLRILDKLPVFARPS